MRKGRATTSMGVISCRSREASLIPNYLRVKATTKSYCSDLGTKNRGRQKGIPGMRKSLLQVQWKQDQASRFVWRPTAAREIR